jgi:hypothetical protein
MMRRPAIPTPNRLLVVPNVVGKSLTTDVGLVGRTLVPYKPVEGGNDDRPQSGVETLILP